MNQYQKIRKSLSGKSHQGISPLGKNQIMGPFVNLSEAVHPISPISDFYLPPVRHKRLSLKGKQKGGSRDRGNATRQKKLMIPRSTDLQNQINHIRDNDF